MKTPLLLIAAFTTLMLGCQAEADLNPPSSAIPVKTVQIQHANMSFPIRTVGTLTRDTEMNLSFKIGGIVDRIMVSEGQKVKKYQLLATLKTTEISNQTLQAKNALEKAERDFQRIKELYANPLATSSTDLYVNINRSKAAMLGIPISTIDFTVRAALTGAEVSRYQDEEGETHDIVVRLPVENKPSLKDLHKIYLPTAQSALVSLDQIARIEFKESPTVISHLKMQRNASITSGVLTNCSVTDATNNIVAKLENMNWPEGYRFEISGEQESRQESLGGLGQAMIIAILSIFGVLVLQFRSFVQPFIIFAALPLAIIGSILTLFIVGLSFSFTAFVGLTSLIGIVINDSIILVDYTNQLQRHGMQTLESIKLAAETRFMPVVLTTATTVAGGTLWAPLGWTIIGGLVLATFLTLIIVPVLYSLIEGKK